VKVWADQDGLVIAGEDTGDDDEEGPARYGGCIALSWDAFEMDRIKAEMKDGVLKVNVPAQDQGRGPQGRVPGQGRVGEGDGIRSDDRSRSRSSVVAVLKNQ